MEEAPTSNSDHQVIEIQNDNLPRCLDLFNGPTPAKYYLEWVLPLHRAAMESDWKTADKILQKHPNLATAVIDANGVNILHIAAGANSSSYFIKKLVNKYMTPQDLTLTGVLGTTPLLYLAQSGDNVEAAKFLIQKNDSLPLIPNNLGRFPVSHAANWGNPRMTSYLLSVTDLHKLTPADRFQLLTEVIVASMYDVAMEVVNQFPDLALYKEEQGMSALHYLASMSLNPHSTGWSSWIINWTSGNTNMKSKGLELLDKLWGKVLRDGTAEDKQNLCKSIVFAVPIGNVEFIAKIVRTYPPATWVKADAKSIFMLAILNRQVEVFNLIYETQGWMKILLLKHGEDGNNALHLVAKLPPNECLNVVTGASLQMQRELLWFKEVEKFIAPQERILENEHGYTPHALFAETHEKLRKEGEKWMKTTATSCFVVAALVATVAFTSALTLPGGDNQDTGIPIFQRDPIFVTFAIADALSLISSCIAILMFMGILTSRYAQDDFLKSLPLKLLIGQTALFLSIALMMLAFATIFFIIFKGNHPFKPIPVIVAIFAAIPVAFFAVDQFPLLLDIYRSTFKAKYLFKDNHRIYKEKKDSDSSYYWKKLVHICVRKND